MLKLGRVTKVKVFFLVLVYVFNIDISEFSAALLKKGLFFTAVLQTLAKRCLLLRHQFFKFAAKTNGVFKGMEKETFQQTSVINNKQKKF